jgi:hypothetical protein
VQNANLLANDNEGYAMTNTDIDDQLIAFESFEDFSNYSKTLFDLSPQEIEGLYRVLLKLQSIGEDPKKIMNYWKKRTCDTDCGDFIRFMIMVDDMDIDDLKQTVNVYDI